MRSLSLSRDWKLNLLVTLGLVLFGWLVSAAWSAPPAATPTAHQPPADAPSRIGETPKSARPAPSTPTVTTAPPSPRAATFLMTESDQKLQWPDTPAAQTAAAHIRVFNTADEEAFKAFELKFRAQSSLAKRPMKDRVSQYRDLRSRCNADGSAVIPAASHAEQAEAAEASSRACPSRELETDDDQNVQGIDENGQSHQGGAGLGPARAQGGGVAHGDADVGEFLSAAETFGAAVGDVVAATAAVGGGFGFVFSLGNEQGDGAGYEQDETQVGVEPSGGERAGSKNHLYGEEQKCGTADHGEVGLKEPGAEVGGAPVGQRPESDVEQTGAATLAEKRGAQVFDPGGAVSTGERLASREHQRMYRREGSVGRTGISLRMGL